MRGPLTFGIVALTAGLLALSGCGSAPDPWKDLPGPPRVVATFPPLYCFIKNVAGDDAGLLALATTNGPHHYEPTVEETLKLRKADLFFANGLELDERFAERMARGSGNPRLSGQTAEGYVLIGDHLLDKGLVDKMSAHAGHGHDHEHDDGHHHGEYDPHLWLGIPQALGMVEVIRDELKKVDPARADAYDRRAADYAARLKKLHEEGKALLAGKKERGLIANHDSLHYFAKSFDLTIAGVIQIQAGTDADPGALAELIKTCQEKKVRVIAIEPQFKQRGAAETLVKELKRRGVPDAVAVEIDPLETVTGDDVLDRAWYEKRVRANLETLAEALR